jgi:hypothetical protein
MLRYGMSSVPVLSWRNLNRYPGYFAAIYPEAVAPRPDKVAEHGIALHKLLNEAVSDGPYAHFERVEIVRLACSLSGLDLTKE